jgi:hypothetical protein
VTRCSRVRRRNLRRLALAIFEPLDGLGDQDPLNDAFDGGHGDTSIVVNVAGYLEVVSPK